jgi:transcriptional regulator with XRE-family HTH domain
MERSGTATGVGLRAERRGTLLPGLFAQRRRRALTQRRLTELAGVAHTSVQQLETLKRGGYPQTILRLSSALGVRPEDGKRQRVGTAALGRRGPGKVPPRYPSSTGH